MKKVGCWLYTTGLNSKPIGYVLYDDSPQKYDYVYYEGRCFMVVERRWDDNSGSVYLFVEERDPIYGHVNQ